MDKQKRVLWLFNHETLRQFEVPLLRHMGFEVYLPKLFPQTEEFGSGSADFSYDRDLTIPSSVLDVLNRHDFYGQKMSAEIIQILNQYFGIVFFSYYSLMQMEQIIFHFLGKLFFHAFGREYPRSYTELLTYPLAKKLFQNQERFFFAQGYSFLSEIERAFLKKRALTFPVALSDAILQQENTWGGGNGHLLFVCPRIQSSPYYKNIYLQFKQNFLDLPHLIAGKQFANHSDPAIQGNLSREEYDQLLRSSEVLFYHSQEPRHLHYHPLEAIVTGLPVIYMHGGVLERFTSPRRLPGGCDTFEEAREKIRRVLNGDHEFVQEIISTQKQLLKYFLPEAAAEMWKKHLSLALGAQKCLKKENAFSFYSQWLFKPMLSKIFPRLSN